WALGGKRIEWMPDAAKALFAQSMSLGWDNDKGGFFYAALPGVTPDNVNWVRRKRNMVLRYFRSSYASGLKLQKDGKKVEDNGLSGAD
ncbi:hypothetical protein ACC811_36770, partial [Rhizobium ruizarguesonis]